MKDVISVFYHMEFCLVLNLTATGVAGKRAIIWLPTFATRAQLFRESLTKL